MDGSSRRTRDGNIFGGIVERSQRKKSVKLAWGMIIVAVLVGLFMMFAVTLETGEGQTEKQVEPESTDPDALMRTPWADTDNQED